MKNAKLSGLLCGANMIDCMPHAPQARDARAPRPGVPGGRRPSLSQLREGGPLSALGPRRPPGFKEGLDDWKGRATGPEQQRAKATELMENAHADGKEVLALSQLGLTRLPSQIGALKKLQLLDLSNNKLTRLPASIGELEKLTRLFVDSNELESLPDEIQNLSQLKRFSAAGNRLSQLPESMHKLERLSSVDLKSNQIWTLPPGWAELLTRLRRLDLSDNQLKQLPELPGNDAAGARDDVRGKTLDVDLSNNGISTLPIGYGSFRYHGQFDNHTLVNVARTIVVRTANTRIREGLVAAGRLASGRGVSAHEAQMFARQSRMSARGKAPIAEDDASLGSFGDYVRRHGEPGQAAPFERSPEAAAEPERGERGEQPEWTKPGGMCGPGEVADLFAALGAPRAGKAGAGFMNMLAAELRSLPESQRAAVLTQLAAVPPAVLEAELARMQTGWQGGAAMPWPLPAAPRFPTQTVPPFGAQPGQHFVPPLGTWPAQQFAPPVAAQSESSGVRPPPGGTSDAWGSLKQPWSDDAAPPWASARTNRSGVPQNDADRWARPQWAAPAAPAAQQEADEPEMNGAYSSWTHEFDGYAWTSPPKATITAQLVLQTEPEQPDILTTLERFMRMVNGDPAQ
jgi:hypothetical protein